MTCSHHRCSGPHDPSRQRGGRLGGAARRLRLPRRRRHRAEPLRAARAARAAERRARPAGGGGRSGIVARPGGHVHGHDRRAGDGGRRRRARRPARCARWRSSCCSAFGHRARRARGRRPARGAARAARALRARAARGDGFWSGLARRRARSASSTRRAPGRSSPRSISVGAASGAHGRGRRSPTRSARRSCCSRSRSAAARSPTACARRARPGAAARAGRRDGRSPRVAMATNLDVRFQTAIADHLPGRAWSTRRSALERSHAVSQRGSTTCAAPSRFAARGRREGADGATCRDSARRPTSPATQRWFNTPGGRPLTLARPARPGRARRLLDLHLHQLHPHAAATCEAWDARYRERRADDRRRAHARVPLRARRRQRRARDPRRTASATRSPRTTSCATWNAWGNQYWPAEYLIDARGPGPLRALRRGRLRQDRGGDPRAAGRGRRGAARAATPRRGRTFDPARAGDARDLPRPRARRALRRRRRAPGTHTYARRRRPARRRATSRSAAPGR